MAPLALVSVHGWKILLDAKIMPLHAATNNYLNVPSKYLKKEQEAFLFVSSCLETTAGFQL